jgi:hypothetical protein
MHFMSQADLAGIFTKLQHLDGVELDKVVGILVHAAVFLF